jgi:hypothetical protein
VGGLIIIADKSMAIFGVRTGSKATLPLDLPRRCGVRALIEAVMQRRSGAPHTAMRELRSAAAPTTAAGAP